MHKQLNTGLTAGILFALGAVASAAGAQAPQASPAPKATQSAPEAQAPAPMTKPSHAECSVSVRDSLPVLPTPVAINASITQSIGDSVKAEFPAESKIVVAGVMADAAAPKTVKLTLDTSAAAPGEWVFWLKGTAGNCAGKIKVTPAAK
ncbi:MAG: hypothetical protein ABJE10_03230 [bacterium]